MVYKPFFGVRSIFLNFFDASDKDRHKGFIFRLSQNEYLFIC